MTAAYVFWICCLCHLCESSTKANPHSIFCSLTFFLSALPETGREVPAEQARADCLWVPGAGGLGVCSPPSRAWSDATLQTPGAELLALAAQRGRGSRLFPLGSPELQLLLEMQNQTPNTSLSLLPQNSFSGYRKYCIDSWLWRIYVSLLSQSRWRLSCW